MGGIDGVCMEYSLWEDIFVMLWNFSCISRRKRRRIWYEIFIVDVDDCVRNFGFIVFEDEGIFDWFLEIWLFICSLLVFCVFFCCFCCGVGGIVILLCG